MFYAVYDTAEKVKAETVKKYLRKRGLKKLDFVRAAGCRFIFACNDDPPVASWLDADDPKEPGLPIVRMMHKHWRINDLPDAPVWAF